MSDQQKETWQPIGELVRKLLERQLPKEAAE